MTNTGPAPVTFTITSNNYRTDGPWTYQVAAGHDRRRTTSTRSPTTHGWYDFTVTVDATRRGRRRSTGHIETGAPSVTG